jgi:ABC-type Mn2+/Zn2+ transport system ATPase subunit
MTEAGAPLVELSKVSVHIGSRQILENITARIDSGQLVTLIGANASGKSTLMRVLGGRQRYSGVVNYPARPQTNGCSAYLAIPATRLPESLCAAQVFDLVKGASRNDISFDSALDYLKEVDAGRFIETPIGACSEGTKHKFCIALGLISKAPLLLLDETLNGLDLLSENSSLKFLQNHARTSGRAVLLVTHNIDLAQYHSDQVWLLHEGKLAGTWSNENLNRLREDAIPLSRKVLNLLSRLNGTDTPQSNG